MAVIGFAYADAATYRMSFGDDLVAGEVWFQYMPISAQLAVAFSTPLDAPAGGSVSTALPDPMIVVTAAPVVVVPLNSLDTGHTRSAK